MTARRHLSACLAVALMGASALIPATAQILTVGGRPAPQASPTYSQNFGDQRDMDRRLDKIEQAIFDLQGALYAADGNRPRPSGVVATPASGTSVAGYDPAALSLRIGEIEASLQTLTGRVEELSFRLEQQMRAMDAMSPAAPAGIAGPADAMPSFGSDLGAPKDLSGELYVTEPIELPDQPGAAFDVAYDLVLADDNIRASEAFEAYIAKFPNAPQTPEAKYLLGEINLATGADAEAARIFLDHVQSYPSDPRSPQAYLNLGIAFARLGKTAEACRVFDTGKARFPSLEARLARRYDDEIARASCN